MVSPPAKREGVRALVKEHERSERRACDLVGIRRSSARYRVRVRAGEAELRGRIRSLALAHRTYGCGQVLHLLRREGCAANEKRVHRLWKAERLQLPRKSTKKRFCGPKGEVLQRALHTGHVWTYDIVEDRTANGAKLRMLTVLDEFTRESLAIRVERSISSRRVLSTLEWLTATRGAPEHIRSDNGPEFIARAVRAWLEAHPRVTFHFTPTSASWLNQVETWFSILSRQAIRRGAFRSVKELVVRIEAFIAAWNAGASPFVWTKTDDEILAKAVRKRPATNEPGH